MTIIILIIGAEHNAVHSAELWWQAAAISDKSFHSDFWANCILPNIQNDQKEHIYRNCRELLPNGNGTPRL